MNEHFFLKQGFSGKTAKRCSAPLARGFTLIEMMIVISIMISLAAIGTSDYFNIRNKKILDSTVERIAADIRTTMERSKAQEDGSQWGIRFWNPAGGRAYYEIWSGPNYSSGIVANKVQLDSSLVFANPIVGNSKDFCFAKSTGLPIICGTVAVTNGFTSVAGTGTSFMKDIGIGDIIRIPGWSPKVSIINTDTSLNLDSNYQGVNKSGLVVPLQNGSIIINSQFKDSIGSVFVNAGGRVNTQIEYGVVGYWSFDENNGNVVNDYSGNGSTGTANNATITNGKIGRARNFITPGNNINLGNKSALNIKYAGTFEFWVKPDLGWAFSAAFLDKAVAQPNINYRIRRYANTNELEFYDGVNIIHGGTITPGSWNYIAVTVNKGAVKGYINGVEVFSQVVANPIPLVNNTANVLIGNSSDGDVFYGILDEVKIYNKSLSAEEVLNHYNENKESF